MSRAHWRLTHDPFQSISADSVWFPGGEHDEALSRMLYAVESAPRCGMICGDRGLGKSRLLREVDRQSRTPTTKTIFLDVTGWHRVEFATALANACGAGLNATVFPTAAWIYLEDWLRGRTAMSGRVVWLLDNVDTTSESIEPDLQRLARLIDRMHAASTLILTMQPTDLAEQLQNSADFAVNLMPWNRDESHNFITDRLASAGGSSAIFTKEAWEVLLDAGHGSPQRLLRIAEIAMAAGSVLEAPCLDGDLLTAVVHQLGWSQPTRYNSAAA